MTVPILVIYMLGFVFLIFTIEGDGKDKRQEIANIVYPGLGLFLNVIGYYVSYSDLDYVTLAYFPLAMLVISLMFLFYRIYQAIPKDTAWGSDDGEKEEFRRENPLV